MHLVAERYVEPPYAVMVPEAEIPAVGYQFYVAPGGDVAVYVDVGGYEHISGLAHRVTVQGKFRLLGYRTRTVGDELLQNVEAGQVGRTACLHVDCHPDCARIAHGSVAVAVHYFEISLGE